MCQREGGALETQYGSNTHPAHEHGVLAVGFLETSPARITGYVNHRRQGQLGAPCAHLTRIDGENASQQLWVPGARQGNRLREARGIARDVAVQTFLVKQDGNAEARILHGEVLHRVYERNRLARVTEWGLVGIATAAQVARTGNLANAGGKYLPRLGLVEITRRSEDFPLAIPNGGDLRDLFLECHAREEILHAFLHRGVGVFVDRLVMARASARCNA